MTFLDDAGLQQLLQHEQALRRLAAALLRDPAEVEDAVQHALVQEAAGKRRPGTPLWPFLVTTLRRYAANVAKLAGRRSAREQAAAQQEAVPGPEQMLQREQLRRRVADAVLALAEPYRTAVWLRWFEGLDAQAVAAQLGVPVATVRSRLWREHAELRQRLDREYGDRRWAVLALPVTGAAIPGLATTGALLIMKKAILAAAVMLVAALGYVAWSTPPREPRMAEPSTQVVRLEGEAAPGRRQVEVDRAVLAPQPTPIPAPSVRQLRVQHADGSPASDLPVWFWTDEATRPEWTRRVPMDQATGRWSAGTGPDQGEKVTDATLRTDAIGAVALPRVAPVAVTVEFVPHLWLSTDLPADGHPLILPALAPIEATLQGARPGDSWHALLQGSWLDAKGKRWIGYSRQNLDLASGPAVLRWGTRQLDMTEGSNLQALVPAGAPCGLSVWADGLMIEPRFTTVDPPGFTVFKVTATQPTLTVCVTEGDGTLAAENGRAALAESPRSTRFAELQQGAARFGTSELKPGRFAVAVLLDSGESLRGEVEIAAGDLAPRVDLRRNRAVAAVALQLDGAPADAVVWIATSHDQLLAADRYEEAGMFGRQSTPAFRIGAHSLWLNQLPEAWVQGFVLAPDGRVATFLHAEPGQTSEAHWLPAAQAQTLDVAALYRELGDLPVMDAVVEVQLLPLDSHKTWKRLLQHRRAPGQAGAAPPVWRDLLLPRELPCRLVISGGDRGAGLRVLREVSLTRN